MRKEELAKKRQQKIQMKQYAEYLQEQIQTKNRLQSLVRDKDVDLEVQIAKKAMDDLINERNTQIEKHQRVRNIQREWMKQDIQQRNQLINNLKQKIYSEKQVVESESFKELANDIQRKQEIMGKVKKIKEQQKEQAVLQQQQAALNEVKRRIDERNETYGLYQGLEPNGTMYKQHIQNKILHAHNEERIHRLCPRVKTLKELEKEAEVRMIYYESALNQKLDNIERNEKYRRQIMETENANYLKQQMLEKAKTKQRMNSVDTISKKYHNFLGFPAEKNEILQSEHKRRQMQFRNELDEQLKRKYSSLSNYDELSTQERVLNKRLLQELGIPNEQIKKADQKKQHMLDLITQFNCTQQQNGIAKRPIK